MNSCFRQFSLIFLFSILLLSDYCYGQSAPGISSVLNRVLGPAAVHFECIIIPEDGNEEYFELSSANGKIQLAGTSQPAIGYALNHYLNQYCHCQLSHTGANLNLPVLLPPVPEKVRRSTPFRVRYNYNYCTYNYSKAFWDWPRWEEELDWMVLHGINMPLSIIGTEAVWQITLRKYGLSDAEILNFIPGPAYTAWWLMGNLEGWGGPVSQNWINQQCELQKKIVQRMRDLGMTPVFQGFYGMVPDTLRFHFANHKIYEGGLWAGDHGFRRPAFLDPGDSLFADIAQTYYHTLDSLYGKTIYYGGDPFHEGGNTEGINIAASAGLIQLAMLRNHPDACWVLQGWWDNPTDDLLAGIDKNHAMVLDLYAEGNPQWERRKGFDGTPWAWCCLLNFGGKPGLYSRLDMLAGEPARALQSPYGKNMLGIGMMMEGDVSNPINAELVFDAAWCNAPIDKTEWIEDFVKARYGSAPAEVAESWQILVNTVLNCPHGQEGTAESIFCARGDTNLTSAWRWGKFNNYYQPADLRLALLKLLSARPQLSRSDAWQFDVVDLTRQVIADSGMMAYRNMMKAYDENNIRLFDQFADDFISLMDDQEILLNTRSEFLLGAWLNRARKNATSAAEQDLFEQNARMLITVWGNKGVAEVLHEYANREWAGMVGALYKDRWLAFIDVMHRRLSGEVNAALPDYYAMESAWTKAHNRYPALPTGDPAEVAFSLSVKYLSH